MPKISVCIPTYNGEDYLLECLESVSKQTFKDFEVIISDNLSKDKTLEIAEQWKKKQDFPVHIYSNPNLGIGKNWNYAIKKSNGAYIKFIFQDDVLKPDALQKYLEYTKYNSENFDLIFSKREVIEDGSEYAKYWLSGNVDLQENLKPDASGNYIVDKDFFKSPMFYKSCHNVFGEPTASFIHRNVFKKIGYFNEDMKQLLDLEFCHRYLKKGNILIIKDKLIYFRVHQNQTTNNNLITNSINEKEQYITKTIPIQYFRYLPWWKYLKYTLKKWLKKNK